MYNVKVFDVHVCISFLSVLRCTTGKARCSWQASINKHKHKHYLLWAKLTLSYLGPHITFSHEIGPINIFHVKKERQSRGSPKVTVEVVHVFPGQTAM